jgi:hypothetical protein
MIGSLAGFWSGFFVRKQVVTRFIDWQINAWMLSRTAYPCLLSLIYVIADRMQAFRFSLEPQLLRLKLLDLWNTPFAFSLSFHSEGLAIVPFFLFSGLTAQLMIESGLRKVRWALLLSLGIGSFLETSELIVASRMMGLQDLLIIAVSCWCGILLVPKMVRRWSSGSWALLIIAATVVTASIDHLSPFQFTGSFKGFNWVPFIAYYEKSSFVALRTFLQELLVFLPLGFALRNALRNRYAAYGVILSITLALAGALEYAQGWTAHGVLEMPDITDILGALGGACAGALLHTPGWARYEVWGQSALASDIRIP